MSYSSPVLGTDKAPEGLIPKGSSHSELAANMEEEARKKEEHVILHLYLKEQGQQAPPEEQRGP